MKQDIYYTRNGILVNVDFMDTVYSTLYKDGFQYTLIDDIYYKVPVDDADDNSVDMFADYGYVESGETELEGKTYKYDEFYQGTTDTFSKFLIDNNKLYAILSEDGSAMYIEKLDDSFEESILSMPSSAKEVTQEEFNTKFVEKVAGKIEE
ncbi:hypothetical protein [Ruminococcus sp. HUN007]|uniref:hypothetical protein n=1 Tax=Ruminococcus sp. HUN007 TaxID=1514668 RepID=UPI0005D13544|nr:hypothetical protein [Ruminococcus sp. HUN007]